VQFCSDQFHGQGAVTYRAADGAKPVFSGDVLITGLKPGADGVWTVRVPEIAEGKWRFNQDLQDRRRGRETKSPILLIPSKRNGLADNGTRAKEPTKLGFG